MIVRELTDETTLADAHRFATSPARFFGHSWHAMHHVEPDRLAALQVEELPEGQVSEVDGLLAGGAAAGPAAHQWLEQENCLGKGQAGRWRFGFCRSRVRNPCAAITSAQWW